MLVYLGGGILLGGLLWSIVEIQLLAASDAGNSRVPPIRSLAATITLGLTMIVFGVLDPRWLASRIGWVASMLAVPAVVLLLWIIAVGNLRFQMTGRIFGRGAHLGSSTTDASSDRRAAAERRHRPGGMSALAITGLLWLVLLLAVAMRFLYLATTASR